MFLKNLKIDHEHLKKIDINFEVSSQNRTTVLFGANGSGKTKILTSIYNLSMGDPIDLKDKFKIPHQKIQTSLNGDTVQNEYLHTHYNNHHSNKIIYVTSESVSRQSLQNNRNRGFDLKGNHFLINSSSLLNINKLIYDFMIASVFTHEQNNVADAKKVATDSINDLFKVLSLNSRVSTIDPTNNQLIFSNITGEPFEINSLSSGELQIFTRFAPLSLLAKGAGIIIIDEPEISLHPSWQINILPILEDLVPENFQIIIATHSPFVLSSTKNESLRRLTVDRESGAIKITDEVSKTYGRDIDEILIDSMELKSLSDPNAKRLINEIQECIASKNIEKSSIKLEEFANKFGDDNPRYNSLLIDLKILKKSVK